MMKIQSATSLQIVKFACSSMSMFKTFFFSNKVLDVLWIKSKISQELALKSVGKKDGVKDASGRGTPSFSFTK